MYYFYSIILESCLVYVLMLASYDQCLDLVMLHDPPLKRKKRLKEPFILGKSYQSCQVAEVIFRKDLIEKIKSHQDEFICNM